MTKPKRLRLSKLFEISFVDMGASGDDQHAARVVFSKRRTQPQGELMKVKKADGLDNMVEQIKGALSEEMQMVLDALLTAIAAGGAKPAEEPSPEPAPDAEKPEDEEAKKEDEEEPMAKRDIDIKKQLDGAIEEIAKLRAEKRRDGFVAKAQSLKAVGGDVEQIAKALDEVDLHLSDESKEFVKGLIDRVESGVAKALTVHGSALGANDGAEIDAVAKERAKSDGISFYQAYAKVAKERPDLYAKAKSAN